MGRRKRSPELSNIRQLIGWIIGHKVIDVTAGDPPDFPDSDPEDAGRITLMFSNGGTLEFECGESGFWHSGDPEKERTKRIARIKRLQARKQTAAKTKGKRGK